MFTLLLLRFTHVNVILCRAAKWKKVDAHTGPIRHQEVNFMAYRILYLWFATATLTCARLTPYATQCQSVHLIHPCPSTQ